MFGAGRSFGIEFEHIHMKALADTSLSYDVEVGAGTVLPPGGAKPMNNVVEEYQMTHGLNLSFVNLVMRRPLNAPDSWRWVARRCRSVVPACGVHGARRGAARIQFAGFDAQGAAGLQIQLPYRLSVVTEYKFTYARPKISSRGRRRLDARAHAPLRGGHGGGDNEVDQACRLGPIL